MHIKTFKIQQIVNGNEVALFPTLLTVKGKHYLVGCGYAETFDAFVADSNPMKKSRNSYCSSMALCSLGEV